MDVKLKVKKNKEIEMNKKQQKIVILSEFGMLIASCLLSIIELIAFKLEEGALVTVYGGTVQALVVFFTTFALISIVSFYELEKEKRNLIFSVLTGLTGLGVTIFIHHFTLLLRIFLPLLDLSLTRDLLVLLLYAGSLVSLIIFLPTSISIFFPTFLESKFEKKGEEQ